MEKAEILEKLKKILASHSSIEPSSVDLEKHLRHDLGFDSLDLAEMVYAIEEEFGITVSDDSTDSIQKVSDTVDYIHKALAAKAAG
jgi:acyl carrier protein